jgi:hypothetical protein
MEMTTDALVEFVCKRGSVSYVELEQQFNDPGGDYVVELRPNVFTWVGLSKGLTESINEAVRNRRIVVTPTVPMVYVIDGKFPRLPIAKKLPKQGYKKPHWFPVVFNSPVK